jgi:hypothetical protein
MNDWEVELSVSRLHHLRSSQIGGILAVVTHWDPVNAKFGLPILRVLASPAVATLGTFNPKDRPGIGKLTTNH